MKIALLTDSTCDLNPEILKEKKIHLLPLKIIFKDREYDDRLEISPQEVYRLLSKEIPTTSMPTPVDIKNKFEEIKNNGYTHLIAIHISSGLSNTFHNIKMMADQYDGLEIAVFDSRALSMGLGRVFLYARKLIDRGLDFEEIKSRIKEKIEEVDLYFVVKTLEYLKKGGRIGKVRGTIGQLLNIKPIISINEEGKYYTFDKERSRKRSIDRLYRIISSKIKKGIEYNIDVMHADALDEAKKLLERFKNIDNVKDTFLGEISPAMVIHSGPGLLGVCLTKYEGRE